MTRILTLCISFGLCAVAADVTGIVLTEHDGSPVAGAAVTLRDGTKVLAELETDDQGKFRAPNLAAGSYGISTSKANFAPAERRVTMETGARAITIRLMRYGVITGSVIDTAGQGVRGAVVVAVPVGPDGMIRSMRDLQSSTGFAADARGRFRVHSLKPGSYVVALTIGSARNMVGTTSFVQPDTSLGNDVQLFPSTAHPQVFQVRGGEEYKADFTVYKGALYNIRGTVSGMSEGTSVQLRLVRPDLSVVPVASEGAPQSREFQFSRVAPGSYRIVARALPTPSIQLVDGRQVVVQGTGTPSYGETTVVVGSQDLTDVTVLTSPLNVKTKVVYEPGAGCPKQVNVTFTSIDFGLDTGSSLQSGVEQTLSLSPTPYWANLTTPNTHCFLQRNALDVRQLPSDGVLRIVTLPLGVIKGRLIAPGGMSEEYEVVLTSAESPAPKSMIPDTESRFSFTDLPPGRYKVSVFKAGTDRSTTEESQELEVSGGSSLEIEFAGIR